mgnify:CR=1 FL=1
MHGGGHYGGGGGHYEGGGGHYGGGGGGHYGGGGGGHYGGGGGHYGGGGGEHGFQQTTISYTNGWNSNVHDPMLQAKIDEAFYKYDSNHSGQL